MALSAATVWRDYETDGIPSSGPHKVKKAEVRQIHAQIDTFINAFINVAGGHSFASKASLDASLNYAANSMAWVLGDATIANYGVNRKIGGSAAGTANAIQATTSIPVSRSALVWTNIFETNTASPVTI
ncbi:hypothetical protein BTE77_08270 [Ensifer adhaerens]|nr:hypothetical protein BTE77_08270 [Ensifer adhaerens]